MAMSERVLVTLVTLVGLAVLAAGRPAAAETVRGYAYITAATSVRKTHKSQANECWVTVQLPATPLAQPPANDDRSALAAATRVGVTVADPFDNCTDYVHTWQLATFDPAHRDHVELEWPAGRPSIILVLIFAALAVLVGGYAVGRVRARRARNRRTVERAYPQ